MFLTHTPFKHVMQLNADATLWTSIEIALCWPWYVATVQDPHEPVQRLGTNDDVLQFAAGTPAGILVALQLFVPRHDVPARTWDLIPIVAVERDTDDRHTRPLAVVIDEDGSKFGGVPAEEMAPPARGLTPLARFEWPSGARAASPKRSNPRGGLTRSDSSTDRLG